MTLTAWRDISDPTTRKLAAVGDSTTERGWARTVREIAQPRWSYGGLGFRHPGKFNTNTIEEWTQTGSWTKGTNTDAWNIGPCGGGLSTNDGTWHASGSSFSWKWTKPTNSLAVTSFDLLVCDGSSSGNFAYRIDGGSWTNVSTTWSQNNSLKKIAIASSVSSTIELRAANAAGTSVDVYFVGGEPHCSSTGLKIHEICAAGQFSNQVIRTSGVAAWDAWFQMEQPQVCTFLFVNDASFWTGGNPAAYQQRIDDFCAMVRGYGGEPVIITYFGWGTIADATQLDKRSREQAVAEKYDCAWVDLYGLAGGAWPAAASYLETSDTVHPNEKGIRFMANHIWNHLGRKLYADKLVRI